MHLNINVYFFQAHINTKTVTYCSYEQIIKQLYLKTVVVYYYLQVPIYSTALCINHTL